MRTDTQKTAPAATDTEAAPAVLSGGIPVGSPDVKDAADLFRLSIPSVGAYRTQEHWYYFNGKGPVPGATAVIGILDKPAVVQWAKNEIAATAVNRWEELGAYIQREGTDTAQKWLKSLPDFQRDTAAKLGSGVHLLADMAARGADSDPKTFQMSPEEIPYLEAFRGFLAFLEAHQGVIISSEKMVWSTDGYAGTYDLLVRFGCDDHAGLWLLDIKTRKGASYPEDALQLIAYGTADWIITEGNPDPYPMPYIQRYGILHLRPDLYTEAVKGERGWRLIEYPLIDSDKIAFLGALEVWRWKQQKRYTKTQKG